MAVLAAHCELIAGIQNLTYAPLDASTTTGPSSGSVQASGDDADEASGAATGTGATGEEGASGMPTTAFDASEETGEAAASGDASASGSTSGAASGTASGSASGQASGSASDSGPSTADCSPTCTTGAACPTQACYVPSANPVPPVGLGGQPDNKLLPPYAIDGNLMTRYTTGAPGVPGDWFQVDLCRNVLVNGVTLNDTVDTTDVAIAYNVEVSLDGVTWMQVASSSTPAPTNLTVTFAAVLARFVRFNQTGTLPVCGAGPGHCWWSIDEFTVSCPGDAGI
jgi:F5/8 type C domain-containing protein